MSLYNLNQNRNVSPVVVLIQIYEILSTSLHLEFSYTVPTDGWRDITRLIVAFSFSKAPVNKKVSSPFDNDSETQLLSL
jgi:hypothetical protein